MTGKRWWTLLLFLFVFPASTNYKLEGFSVGNAGGAQIGSSNYSLNGVAGEAGSNQMVGNSFGLGAGLVFTQLANVPKITLTNPSNYYNKLQFTLDTQNNPSDATYAIAISKDNFATTQYIKKDGTVGTSLAFTDYQTYSQWGGGSGSLVVGLDVGTTYTVKAKARQGNYSETGWGPISLSGTVNPTLTFGLNVGATYAVNPPPYDVSFGDLQPSVVTNSQQDVWVDFATNATSGGNVFVYGQNGGLYSSTVGYTIPAMNGSLGGVNEGFGAQGVGTSQGGGGPMVINSPYDGAGDVVGITDTTIRPIFSSVAPLTSGRGSFVLKAKASSDTPAASDYTEVLTVIGSANF